MGPTRRDPQNEQWHAIFKPSFGKSPKTQNWPHTLNMHTNTRAVTVFYSLIYVYYTICICTSQAKLNTKITMLVKKGNRNTVPVIKLTDGDDKCDDEGS